MSVFAEIRKTLVAAASAALAIIAVVNDADQAAAVIAALGVASVWAVPNRSK